MVGEEHVGLSPSVLGSLFPPSQAVPTAASHLCLLPRTPRRVVLPSGGSGLAAFPVSSTAVCLAGWLAVRELLFLSCQRRPGQRWPWLCPPRGAGRLSEDLSAGRLLPVVPRVARRCPCRLGSLLLAATAPEACLCHFDGDGHTARSRRRCRARGAVAGGRAGGCGCVCGGVYQAAW